MSKVQLLERSPILARPLMHRLRVAGATLALSLLTVVASASPAFAWATTAFSPSDEQLLLSLTNHDRASAGLPALTNDSYLHKEAEWRAKDMGDRDYFSHTIPPGNKMVFSDMMADHYCFKVAGENIGLSTFGDGDATSHIEIAFMGSPSHRANILGTWGRIGVGAYKAADGRKLYAVLFSVPCASKAKPVPKTTTPPAPKTTPTTPRSTSAPTAAVAPTPGFAATPTATAEPTATTEPMATTEPLATVDPVVTFEPTTVAAPSSSPPFVLASPVEIAPNSGSVSLRVRQAAPSRQPFEAFLSLFFGGLLG